MMRIEGFREKMLSGAPLAGTFLKTPAYQVVEVLARSELDFVCLDAEHAPFDRGALDACIGMGRALDFPVLVRVGDGSAREILQALDYGAVGIVVPHVDSAEKAAAVALAARYGPGGRGYAGSTRFADYGGQGMPALFAKSRDETVVIAQIEEPAGVEACEAIAATDGIDGVFLGPSDLSVGYGYTSVGSPELDAAMRRVGAAARASKRAYISFVPDADKAQDWAKDYGISVFFVASEHSWLRAGANAVAQGIHALSKQG